jgi:hypothetical protein
VNAEGRVHLCGRAGNTDRSSAGVTRKDDQAMSGDERSHGIEIGL